MGYISNNNDYMASGWNRHDSYAEILRKHPPREEYRDGDIVVLQVVFGHGGGTYCYRSKDNIYKPGDLAEVSVRGEAKVVKVVSVGYYSEKEYPFRQLTLNTIIGPAEGHPYVKRPKSRGHNVGIDMSYIPDGYEGKYKACVIQVFDHERLVTVGDDLDTIQEAEEKIDFYTSHFKCEGGLILPQNYQFYEEEEKPTLGSRIVDIFLFLWGTIFLGIIIISTIIFIINLIFGLLGIDYLLPEFIRLPAG